MSQSYLLLWPQKRIDRLKKDGYGIDASDIVYVVGLRAGVVHVVVRLEIEKVISADDYFRDHLRLSAKDLKLHLWDFSEKLAREKPQLGHRLPFGCVDEAAVVASSSPVTLDAAVPADVLAALRFRTKRGEERSLPLEDGRLRKLVAIQGHFHRLTPETALFLERLVASRRGRSAAT